MSYKCTLSKHIHTSNHIPAEPQRESMPCHTPDPPTAGTLHRGSPA